MRKLDSHEDCCVVHGCVHKDKNCPIANAEEKQKDCCNHCDGDAFFSLDDNEPVYWNKINLVFKKRIQQKRQLKLQKINANQEF